MRNGDGQQIDRFAAVGADLADWCAAFTPADLDSDQAAILHRQLARADRLLAGARTRLLNRLADIPRPAGGTDKSTADYIARVEGTSTAAARKDLVDATALAGSPEADRALAAGRLSPGQASAVADAVGADPEAAQEMLDAAGTEDLPSLRARARKVITRSDPDPDATWRRHHERRSFRHRISPDGEFQAWLNGTSDRGAAIVAAVSTQADRRFRAAHRKGTTEPREAYAFDALLDLITAGARNLGLPVQDDRADQAEGTKGAEGTEATEATEAQVDRVDAPPTPDAPSTPTPAAPDDAPDAPDAQPSAGDDDVDDDDILPTGPAAKIIVRVDLPVLLRGAVLDGETCEIAGIGAVAYAAIAALLPDGHLAYVIRRGQDVNVSHLGRKATAFQRTAMEDRDVRCEVPGCGRTQGLEIDHTDDWADTHRTRLGSLGWLCRIHHRQRTTHGYRLIGPAGDRRWVDVDGRDVTAVGARQMALV